MSEMNYVTGISPENWNKHVLRAEMPIAVFFWAPWCPWSDIMYPTFEKLAPQYRDKARMIIVNVDENPDLASKHGIDSTPTIKFFFFGRSIGEIVGYLPEWQLREEIDKVLGRYRGVVQMTNPTTSTHICPYCGETKDCYCCIGFEAVTGGG